VRLVYTLVVLGGCSIAAWAQPSIGLSSSPNPSLFGQTVTLTITNTGVPSGATLTVLDGSATIGTPTVTNGTATMSTSTFTPGTHSLVAYYSSAGAELFTSNTLAQVVNKLASGISLSAQPNPSSFGTAVTLTATVTSGATGMVTFMDGNAQIGTSSIGNGTATLSISTLAVGSHQLTATYAGDANYAGSTALTITLVVNPATSSITVTASPNPAIVGAQVTITATLNSTAATGTVTFFDNGTSIGAGNVVNGSVSISTSTLALGSHPLTATYSGDSNFPPSAAAQFTESVKLSSQTGLTASPNPANFGQTVTLTATVTPSAATGTVTFNDGGTAIGSATLSGGVATLTSSTLSAGSHSLTATYNGDTNYITSTSPAATETINGPPSTAVTIASTPSGVAFTVSGTGCNPGSYSTPATLNFATGSTCTVTLTSPFNSQTGAQYVFAGWQDGGTANPRTIATPAQATTYTANFTTQYLLTAQASPAAGGSVSGGGFYNAGDSATLTATPAAGYRLLFWGGVPNPTPGSTTLKVTATSAALTVTAYFAPDIPAPSGYVVSQVTASGTAGTLGPAAPINNFGQVVGWNDSSAFLFTPTSANSNVGTLTNLGTLPGGGNVQAFSVNDRGQVVGRTSQQAFLWTPAAINGSAGIMTAIASGGTPLASANEINSYGEVVGGYLWTPSVPNGNNGTTSNDNRFNTAVAINNSGQVITTGGGCGNGTPGSLFTPTSANGNTGTFAAIPGLSGSIGDQLIAVNNAGSVLGVSCLGFGGPWGFFWHGFIWTPASASAPTGSSAELSLPTGFALMYPYAFNSLGQVVGVLIQSNGIQTPFLYSGGSFFDLTRASGSLIQGSAVGINDAGQVVVTAGGALYLLTPQTLPQTGPRWSITKSHNGSFAPGQNGATYTIAVSNSGNGATSGAVTVMDNLPAGLTLVSMAGTNWTCTTNSCTRSDALAANGSYPPIIVTVNVAATAPANVVNQATISGGGALPVSASDPTAISSVLTQTPGVGSLQPVVSSGAAQSFVFQFSDPSGWQTLSVVNVLINTALDGRQACYIAYSVANNVLYLVPDNGTGLLTGLVLNGSGATSNNQCTVSGAGSSATGTGTILTLTLNISFNASFVGNKVIYAAARDVLNNSGWVVAGAHAVTPLPSVFPTPTTMNPSSGSTLTQVIAFSYKDQTDATNLQTVWALINFAVDGRAACYVAYYRPGNLLYLYPDNGDGTAATSIPLTGTNTIANSQCSISAQGSSVQVNGDTLKVTLPITFKTPFAGSKGVWMAAQTVTAQTSPWQIIGQWSVPGQ